MNTPPSASWVIVDRKTGRAVMETYNPELVLRVNGASYEVVPIMNYLGRINQAIRNEGKQS